MFLHGHYDVSVEDNEGNEPEQPQEPIGEEEKEALRQDLLDVQILKELLGDKGIRGVVFYCPDCEEDHYLGWDLLAGNLKELLEAGEPPVHEPAFDPDPDDYVSWDFARGFLDGYESFEQEELGDVVMRLIAALKDKGWTPGDVRGLLASVGLQVPRAGESTGH